MSISPTNSLNKLIPNSLELQKKINDQINQMALQEIEIKELRMKNRYLETELERIQNLYNQVKSVNVKNENEKFQTSHLQSQIQQLIAQIESNKKTESDLQNEIKRLHMQNIDEKKQFQLQIDQINKDNQKLVSALEEASKIKDQLLSNLTKEIHQISSELNILKEENKNLQFELAEQNSQQYNSENQIQLINELQIKLKVSEQQIEEIDQLKLKLYEQNLIIKRLEQNELFFKSEMNNNLSEIERQKTYMLKSFEEQSLQLTLAKDDFNRKSQFILQDYIKKEREQSRKNKQTSQGHKNQRSTSNEKSPNIKLKQICNNYNYESIDQSQNDIKESGLRYLIKNGVSPQPTKRKESNSHISNMLQQISSQSISQNTSIITENSHLNKQKLLGQNEKQGQKILQQRNSIDLSNKNISFKQNSYISKVINRRKNSVDIQNIAVNLIDLQKNPIPVIESERWNKYCYLFSSFISNKNSFCLDKKSTMPKQNSHIQIKVAFQKFNMVQKHSESLFEALVSQRKGK